MAQADHELITRISESAHRLFAGERPADADAQFANLQQLLTVRIVEHFAFEEKNVFPGLLAGNPEPQVVQAVTQLILDHAPMLETIQQLNTQIYQRTLTNCTDNLWTAVMDFLSDLLDHAAQEDRLYTALLERAANPIPVPPPQIRWMRDGDQP